MSGTELPSPTRCAVVTMEMQRGVVGDLATMPMLTQAAIESGALPACGRLVATARDAGIPVVHATVSWRADRLGTSLNNPLSASLARNPEQILDGSDAVELVPELGDTTNDLFSHRHHGLTPFTGTNLDATLRSLDVEDVVVCGASVNVGVMGLVLNAVDLGYRVTVPTDAIIGVPTDYTEAVIANTFRMVATLTRVDALITRWAES